LKETIIKLAVEQFMKWLLVKLPFLSFGPLNYITSYIMEKVITKVVEQTILGVKIMNITREVNDQVKEVEKVVEKLKTKEITLEEKERLDAELEQRVIDLIKFN
jgi:hypothetical protein